MLVNCGWEFFGCFSLAFASLIVANYIFYRPRSAVVHGLVAGITVFVIVTALIHFSGSRDLLLNPAAAALSRARGQIETGPLLMCVIAQVLGFLMAYVVFRLLVPSTSSATSISAPPAAPAAPAAALV
jgi:glycerol uptake facilitator-like aquaporin